MNARTLPLIVSGLCLAAVFCMAGSGIERAEVTPVMLSTPYARWVELGTITGQQALPGIADRDYTTVAAITDANSFTWTVPNYGRKVQMCFQTTADSDSTTIALMGFADAYSYGTSNALVDDDAVYLGQLALTGGQQYGKHSNVYVDTIVPTDGVCSFTVLDSANNRRCVVEFNSKYKIIVAVATTLAAKSTLYAEGRICP